MRCYNAGRTNEQLKIELLSQWKLEAEFRKNLQYDFPKMRGGAASKAVWNISENSSVLVALVFPKQG